MGADAKLAIFRGGKPNGSSGGPPCTVLNATDNKWINDHFAAIPATQYWTDNTAFWDACCRWDINNAVFHDIVMDFGGSSGTPNDHMLKVVPSEQVGGSYQPAELAFKNLVMENLHPTSGQSQQILIIDNPNGHTTEPTVNVYIFNVTTNNPLLTPFVDFGTTNWDSINSNDNNTGGSTYMANVDITGWADGAIDNKMPTQLVNVNTHPVSGKFTENAIKVWSPGPHYIVDSTIVTDPFWALPENSNRYGKPDGGGITVGQCNTEVRVWNSTVNGHPITRNDIACGSDGELPPPADDPSVLVFTQLTADPTTTGEMHPMFWPENQICSGP